MTKPVYILILTALFLAGCASAPKAPTSAVPPGKPPAGWELKENWNKLSAGMSQADVAAILGKPDREEFGRWLTYWRYGTKLDGPQIMFDSDRRTANYWIGPK